ncbi:MAG: extracellular solute-binding protein [Caldithrix sp.]|nr:extracellular solute-binding protein [Caldithrix sp.]
MTLNMQRFNKSAVWVGSFIVAALALIIFLFLPVNQHSLGGKQITKLYYADNISDAHQRLIDRFNARYQNQIEVVPVNLPFSKFTTNERKEILARALRSKSDRLDIFAVDLIWTSRFGRWAKTLDGYIETELLTNLQSEALSSCYVDQKLVALPLYIDVGLLYYRKDLIEQLPNGRQLEQNIQQSLPWGRFLQVGKQFKKRGFSDVYLFAGDSFEGLVCNFMELLDKKSQNRIFGSDSVELNSPASRQALKQLVDLIHLHGLTPQNVTRFDEYKSYIYAFNNDVIFVRGWPGLHQHFRDLTPEQFDIDNLAMAPLPHFNTVQKPGVFGGWNLMIARDSDKTHEALTFLKFVLQPRNQKILYEIGGYIPTHLKVYEEQAFVDKHPELEQYFRLLNKGKHRPYREDYTRISDIMSYYFNLALKKELSVRQALVRAEQEINSKRAFIK